MWMFILDFGSIRYMYVLSFLTTFALCALKLILYCVNCCRFLREELSSTQVDLIKSRSEVKVLLEELGAYKTLQQPGQSGAQFPNLLLSSLDKLFEDKQQQLWLVLTQSQFTKCTIYTRVYSSKDLLKPSLAFPVKLHGRHTFFRSLYLCQFIF